MKGWCPGRELPRECASQRDAPPAMRGLPPVRGRSPMEGARGTRTEVGSSRADYIWSDIWLSAFGLTDELAKRLIFLRRFSGRAAQSRRQKAKALRTRPHVNSAPRINPKSCVIRRSLMTLSSHPERLVARTGSSVQSSGLERAVDGCQPCRRPGFRGGGPGRDAQAAGID
jgi:hypothetical protein